MYIKKISEFISESLVGKNAFLALEKEYDNNETYKRLNFFEISLNARIKDTSNILVSLFNKNYFYTFYNKKKLRPTSYEGRYLYKIDKDLNIFLFDEYHLNKISNDAQDELKYYYGLDDFNEVINKIMIDTQSKHYIIRMICLNDQTIKEKYDGFYNDENSYYIFLDVVNQYIKLIGGKYNFDLGTNLDFDIPKFVLDELVRYTDMSNRKISTEVYNWLEENYPKPTESIKIFRGISFKNDPLTINKYIGIKNINDININSVVVLNRRKESSWTYKFQTAKSFVDGLFGDDINIVVMVNMAPNDILIDFTLMPQKYRHLFKFQHQNEVLAKKGKYVGIIKYIDIQK